MRAWQVQRHGEPRDVLRLVEIDEPVPGPGEIRLRVQAAAIGMPDAFMCRATYAFSPPVPFVPGQEVCGIVDAVGDGVDVALGTRLMGVTSFTDGRGGFAEQTIVPAASAYRVPDTMTDADAASFRIGFSTAWIGLVRRGALQPGEWLLVLGAAGGSGVTAIQLAHALGARVIAVAAGPEKLAFCTRMGADVVIDRTTQSVPETVLAATGGRGADVVYDPVGGAPAAAALRCIAPGARFLAIGFASGEWVQVNTHDLVARNASVVGVYAGGYTREENEADHEALLALATQGVLAGFATTVPFDDLDRAVEAVASGRAIGKMVVQIG
jgi:NADPH:quinone reductase